MVGDVPASGATVTICGAFFDRSMTLSVLLITGNG